jgi:hypothetical protein
MASGDGLCEHLTQAVWLPVVVRYVSAVRGPVAAPARASRAEKRSGAGWLGWVLALGFLGQLVEDGLGAGGALVVDGS